MCFMFSVFLCFYPLTQREIYLKRMKSVALLCGLALVVLAITARSDDTQGIEVEQVPNTDDAAVAVADDAEAPEPEEDKPDPRMANLTESQLSVVKEQCASLKDMLAIIKERHDAMPEATLWNKLSEFMGNMEDDLYRVHKKYHDQIDCETAKKILQHEHASAYVAEFEKLVKGHKDGHSIREVEKKVKDLYNLYVQIKFGDEETVEHLKHLTTVFTRFEDILEKTKAALATVLKQTEDAQCREKLEDFLKVSHDFQPVEDIPKYWQLKDDVLGLVIACDGPQPTDVPEGEAPKADL